MLTGLLCCAGLRESMAPLTHAGLRCWRLRMAALAAALLCAAAALPRVGAAPPNLIFILTDDADAMHGVS